MARRNRSKIKIVKEELGKAAKETILETGEKELEKMSENEAIDPVKVTTDAIFVCREKGSYLLFNAYKVKIENGVVVKLEQLTRAGDMFRLAVSVAANRLWEGRARTTEEVFK